MKQKNATYFVSYIATILGYRLTYSRTGNGRWQEGLSALPECLRSSFDVNVRRDDTSLYDIYTDLFTGTPTDLSCNGTVNYRFKVTSAGDYKLKLVGVIDAAAVPLSPVPDAIVEAVRNNGSNRWRWDELTTSYTSKDADLEPHGHQGVTLVGVTKSGKTLHAVAHIGKTVVGSDVWLNLREGQDEERAREIYLEQAQEIAIGCDVAGEWDGDSWYFSDSVPFTVRVGAAPEATADAVRRGTERALKHLEAELVLADTILNHLSGWRDNDGKPCKEGEPPPGSIAWALENDEQEAAV